MGRAARGSLIIEGNGCPAGLIVARPGGLPDDCFHLVSLCWTPIDLLSQPFCRLSGPTSSPSWKGQCLACTPHSDLVDFGYIPGLRGHSHRQLHPA